jgi:hypothetical protein
VASENKCADSVGHAHEQPPIPVTPLAAAVRLCVGVESVPHKPVCRVELRRTVPLLSRTDRWWINVNAKVNAICEEPFPSAGLVRNVGFTFVKAKGAVVTGGWGHV